MKGKGNKHNNIIINIKELKKRQKRVKILKERTINPNIKRNNSFIYSIIANKPHRITEQQIKSIRSDLLTVKGISGGRLLKYFKIKLYLNPNKVLTQKGILRRMGSGKAKPRTFVLYVTPGKICLQLKPKNLSYSNSILPIKVLSKFIRKYPFFSFVQLP